MEYLIAIIAILGGAVALLFRNLQIAKTDEKLAEAKGQDKQLEATEDDIKAAIAELDNGINKVKEQRETEARKAAEDNMTLKERADRIRKGLQ